MYLSKLEIVGFKSFAQKVSLAFDSGISSIVGPNGCGKTNIVDAIRWVLGEQRYSALRSDKMEDVIFNGTKTRKALGMAEASLVIENTRGILPSEYTQVTVGRRVYRSGESEYLLNKTPCRLKDILDLFMDTGMGPDAYSVIELKMIETILSDKAEERRRLFEEAAGVTKYKHRRKAAYRKLDDVRTDLIRVHDIVAEVQKSVASLERQAKKAEQFNELKGRLHTLEVDLMEREFTQMYSRIDPLEEKIAFLQTDSTLIDSGLANGEVHLDDLRVRLLASEKMLAEAQRDVSLQRERIHAIEQRTVVGAERISALKATVDRAVREEQELIGDLANLEEAKASLTTRIATLDDEGGRIEANHRQKQEESRAFEAQLDERRRELQELNERTIALVQAIAKEETEQEKKRGRADTFDGRAAQAVEETSQYEQELERIDAEVAAMTARDRQLRRSFLEAEVAFYDAEKKKGEFAAHSEEIQRNILNVRAEIDRRTARIDFLHGLLESREGLPEGVRYLASKPEWSSNPVGTVADILHAEERLRPALEAALGDTAACVVVQNAEEALAAIGRLKEDEKGKVSFVCLDRVPVIASRVSIPAGEGVIGWAADLASFDAQYADLFRFLFDRVVIVESHEVARRCAADLPGIRCVSLDGELESGAGVMRGGSQRKDEGGLIGKQQQINTLRDEMEFLRVKVGEIEALLTAAHEDGDRIDLKSLNATVKSVEKEMNGVEVRIAQLEFEKRRAGEIIARNREIIAVLERDAAALRLEIEAAAPSLATLKARKSDAERQYGAIAAALETLESEWNKRSSEVNELGISIVRSRNDASNARAELEWTLSQTDVTHEAIEKRRAEAGVSGEAIVSTESSMLESQVEQGHLQEELNRLHSAQSEAEHLTSGIRDDIHRIELAIKDQRRTHDESLRVLHEHELQLHDLKTRVEHLVARARDEFEMELVRRVYPEDEFVDFAALREDVPRLRERIKNLGNINFAAFEEYTQERERFETLERQRADLLEAERNLLATIEEINTTAQNLFLETFAKIRTNFIETFKSLFDPGDECDLKLEENVDPLEAKVEIVAKPRGKRPTSIDLLSGGEKTLTAIALLFAIYLVKPSPFCILDEVDAPLDDANIDRFTRILRKFSNNTQFIVVTHNKRTMEAANALYGVTMEEEGVSKIVTVRFNQGGVVSSAVLATG